MMNSIENVSWHVPNCTYRHLIEGKSESNLNADIDIRKSLEDKFITEVKALRHGRKKYKKKPKSKSALSRLILESELPLTLKEELYVREKVDQLMRDPRGVIRWYLDGQRRFFRRYKEAFRKKCRCEKMVTNVKEEAPPMPKLIQTEGQVQMVKLEEKQVIPEADIREEEEDGIYF